ncbi:MAG: hypothetical protein KVP17_003515 [Porospora cf. gigantea B]|uniref:uncharacterized protein n=1 Tax=Porospora cf. gigantea B TaxID=2853592 RepID=UPI003571F72F|nr:MAG: hypothetical protein KVP17_003515 [Porospora cf. gigantea B]
MSVVPDSRTRLPKLQLYMYDHCPFCVRPRVMLGLKRVKYDSMFLANDDVDTPTSLIGKKMVPIMVIEGGDDKLQQGVMVESLDIVRRIDEDETLGPRLLLPGGNSALQQFVQDVYPWIRRLLYCRFYKTSVLPEFSTKEARETFRVRHPLREEPEDYEENFRRTPEWLTGINPLMARLEGIVACADHITGDGVSYDDITVFPLLRNLTIVKGIEWGAKTRNYIETMAQRCDVPLYDQLAL